MKKQQLMRAMVLRKKGEGELYPMQLPMPVAGSRQILIRVHACGICRTDLHVIDGELQDPALPLIPGHQIVGTVEAVGSDVVNFVQGQRVGVPWLGGTCGKCFYCYQGRENLCDHPVFTGYSLNGGFAEYCVADAAYCFLLPADFSDVQVAPLLCAGLIGYRALRKTGTAMRIGLYGFGAAAHIVTQTAIYEGREVYALTRPGDIAAQSFALSLGVKWAGDTGQIPPVTFDAAIIFAPAGELVPIALKAVHKGGIVVCAGIHMSEIPAFSYDLLWGERVLCSVANLARADGERFLSLAPAIPIKTDVHVYTLDQVNTALDDLRNGRFTGAGVIKII